MISAAIFDLDGTLVDSNDLHVQAWQETFRHFGKEIPLSRLRAQIGKGGCLVGEKVRGSLEFFSAQSQCDKRTYFAIPIS